MGEGALEPVHLRAITQGEEAGVERTPDGVQQLAGPVVARRVGFLYVVANVGEVARDQNPSHRILVSLNLDVVGAVAGGALHVYTRPTKGHDGPLVS